MKRISLLFGLLLMSINQLYPQINFGIKGGINSFNFYGENVHEKVSDKTGFVIGGFMTYYLSKSFALQSELIYSKRGGGDWPMTVSITGDNFYYPSTTTVSHTVYYAWDLKYFEVPIIAKYYLLSEKIKPYISAGGQIGYLLSAKIRRIDDNTTSESDILESMEKLDFGYGLGAGVDLSFGGYWVFIDFRYTPSIKKVFTGDDKIKNTAFMISTGIGL